MAQGKLKDKAPLIAFAASLLVLGGVGALFMMEPAPAIVVEAKKGYEALKQMWLADEPLRERKSLPWYYQRIDGPAAVIPTQKAGASEGLNLVTRLDDMFHLGAQLETMSGEVVTRWSVDWFERWPQADHVPDFAVPKSPPGTHLHGSLLLEDGSAVLIWEYLGIMRIAPDGKEMWRLPIRAHHSLHRSEDGHIWTGSMRERSEPDAAYPERKPPYDEHLVVELSSEGELLREWNIPAILAENDLGHLLTDNQEMFNEYVRDDILHLNDAEPFPKSMEPGVFGPQDIMVSLRNVSVVLVFDRETQKVKYVSKKGMFTYQHDPDFLDGNRFSVFDNNSITARQELNDRPARIVVVDARDDRADVYFEGSKDRPFSSAIMGKHQWLPNGNLLITESMRGRAFELNPNGQLVWERLNFVDEGVVGVLSEVLRVPVADVKP